MDSDMVVERQNFASLLTTDNQFLRHHLFIVRNLHHIASRREVLQAESVNTGREKRLQHYASRQVIELA